MSNPVLFGQPCIIRVKKSGGCANTSNQHWKRGELFYCGIETHVTWDLARKMYFGSTGFFFSRQFVPASFMFVESKNCVWRTTCKYHILPLFRETLYMLQQVYCERAMYPVKIFWRGSVSRVHLRLGKLQHKNHLVQMLPRMFSVTVPVLAEVGYFAGGYA